jgi:hypothetical protein
LERPDGSVQDAARVWGVSKSTAGTLDQCLAVCWLAGWRVLELKTQHHHDGGSLASNTIFEHRTLRLNADRLLDGCVAYTVAGGCR